jgi:ABC-type Fe3+-hydroxamate transport system substrate-binding protein
MELQLNNQLHSSAKFPSHSKRIISLVPSQTELLYHLGLEDEVVGITKFCVHPTQWHKNKTRVGGTKNVNIEKVKALQPTLIIANKEENVKEQVEALQQIAPIYVLTNKRNEALQLCQQIQDGFNQLPTNHHQLTTAYLIWQNPIMVAGGNTFITDMLQHCGFTNVFANQQRYPQITIDEINAANPQFIFLSSEPYPFKQKHIDELQTQIPKATILLVDGEMFSWYGSRLLQATNYFKQLIASCRQLI